jgi:hypothetical protein
VRGPSWGHVRYRERIAPLRSIAKILKKPGRDFTVTRVGTVTPLVTNEGEYAAAVDIEGTANGQEIQRSLGVVFGDDWYSEITAVAFGRPQFAMFAGTVRELVRDERLLLGVRRRRYVYTPPVGWNGYSRLPLFTTWFSPEFPAQPTSISVYPAIPTMERGDPSFRHVHLGPVAPAEIVEQIGPRMEVKLDSGLIGAAWDFRIRDEASRDLVRRVMLVRDGHYLYKCHLDTPKDHVERWVPTWKALVESIRPLPVAKVAGVEASLFEHLY